MSYPFASRYVDQFPKDKTVQISRFVAFVAGALAAVLALASVIDPELFLGFEITPERTVLFYLGVFGTVWAVARGAVPEETLVFDPEYALNNVIEYTRYLPAQWNGRLHSNEVRKEFAMLYQMKLIIFIEEILSIIFTPFVLWFSLPKCSDRLVDFFREFTVHVDGLGYVCSFAVFDFKRAPNVTAQQQAAEEARQGLREEYYSSKDGKMLASYFGFLDNYAANPRSGGHPMHAGARRHFYPPPAFQGLISPTSGEGFGGARKARQPERLNRSSIRPGASMTGHSTNRMQRVPMGGQAMSSMPSMLLDPHHQPSALDMMAMPGHSMHAKHRASRHAVMEEPIEDDEEESRSALPAQMGGAASSGSGGMGDDSNLGESWKTTRAAAADDEEDGEDEEDVDTVAGDKGAGVLGLLYQFQKAQEGRSTGVNI